MSQVTAPPFPHAYLIGLPSASVTDAFVMPMSISGLAGSWQVQPLSVGHAGNEPAVPPPAEPPLPVIAGAPADAFVPAAAVMPPAPVDADLPAVPVEAGVPAVAVIAGVPAVPVEAEAAEPVAAVPVVPVIPVMPVMAVMPVEAPDAAVGGVADLPAEPFPEDVLAIGGPGATSVTAGFAHPTALAIVTLPSTSNVFMLVIVNDTPFRP